MTHVSDDRQPARHQDTGSSVISDKDTVLIRAIAARDPQALAELMAMHGGWALSFAERLCGDHQVAEESVQNAFLKLWNQPSSFAGRARFRTWFYRVVHNQVIDAVRKRRPEGLELDDTIEDERPGPEQNLLSNRHHLQIRKALDGLPERQRLAIILSHFEGMSQSEAAHAMEINEGALESLLSRGRANLRKQLTSLSIMES